MTAYLQRLRILFEPDGSIKELQTIHATDPKDSSTHEDRLYVPSKLTAAGREALDTLLADIERIAVEDRREAEAEAKRKKEIEAKDAVRMPKTEDKKAQHDTNKPGRTPPVR